MQFLKHNSTHSQVVRPCKITSTAVLDVIFRYCALIVRFLYTSLFRHRDSNTTQEVIT